MRQAKPTLPPDDTAPTEKPEPTKARKHSTQASQRKR